MSINNKMYHQKIEVNKSRTRKNELFMSTT